MNKKISFITFGCKTNHYDTDVMAGMCRKTGFEVVGEDQKADVYVVNTCTVTSSAETRGRNLIRYVIKNNPNATVIVCGCASQIDPQRYKDIEGVDHVFGVRCGEELIKKIVGISKFVGVGERISGGITEAPTSMDMMLSGPSGKARLLPVRSKRHRPPDILSPKANESLKYHIQPRARAFLKIQDGCNNSCAYCIVPFARGPSLSVPVEQVVSEAKKIISVGHREIILTGIHIGRYGYDLKPKTSLGKLVRKLLSETENCRLRLSSLDPDEVAEDIFQHPRVCRHLHLSLQSGSDEVLKMMNRKVGHYTAMIESLAMRVPGIAIGADIIVGFPGETNAHFEETVDFIEKLLFAYLQVFPFSQRPGTKAALMPNQVLPKTKKLRRKILFEISEKKRRLFYESQIGKTLDVIVVGPSKGISDNYISTILPDGDLKYREMYKVKLVTGGRWRKGRGITGYLEGGCIYGCDAATAES